jgi:serine phosphatase RsbU (regulator of sigma subunit)
MKNSLSLLLLFLLSLLFNREGVSFAQNKKIDSLLSLIKTDKADTNKVNHFMELTAIYSNENSDTAIYFAEQAKSIAEEIKDNGAIVNALMEIGWENYIKGFYSKALDCYLEALKLTEESKNEKQKANILGNIGSVYYSKGDYSEGLDYYLKSLAISEKLGDKGGIGTKLSNIGSLYFTQSDYSKALDYFLKALQLDEMIESKDDIVADLVNIGSVYYSRVDYTQALEYFNKGLKISEEYGNKRAVATCLSNIGDVYKEKKDYPKALAYYAKTAKIANELGDKILIATVLFNTGALDLAVGNYKESELHLKKANRLYDSIGALDELRDTENTLSQLYSATGQFEQAFIHYTKATELKDSLFSQENKKELVRKEMNYEFDKKAAEVKLENEKQKAIAEERERKQNIITGAIVIGLLLVLLFTGYVLRSLQITRKQKQIIEIKNTETEHQKHIIEEKNKDITDSINYAKRIQNALLREEEHVSTHLPEHFILFMPKDIVSGDFYWGAEKNNFWYFAVADCTGHGVPGAIMSMLGISFLNDIVLSENVLSPAQILDLLCARVIKELRQKDENVGNKDGMDISLCRLNLKTQELQWAGANNSLYLIQNEQLKEIKADKQPIGYHPESHPFSNHEIQLQKGDSIYVFSDGYADQFGGEKGKKFKYKQLETLLVTNNNLPMIQQKKLYKQTFVHWKGQQEQVDDVCILGVRI